MGLIISRLATNASSAATCILGDAAIANYLKCWYGHERFLFNYMRCGLAGTAVFAYATAAAGESASHILCNGLYGFLAGFGASFAGGLMLPIAVVSAAGAALALSAQGTQHVLLAACSRT